MVPIEDICSVLLESRQIQISAAALECLAVSGITVFFCDEKHLPSAQILPMNQFSRQRKMLYAQFELSRPIQKQLWKCIVQQKIKNQAACLRLSGKSGFEELEAMIPMVRSGDVTNVEAQAAAFYFPHLFHPDFTRGDICLQNATLNYGYAILRGAIARNLVMHGLEPCIGLQHHIRNFLLKDGYHMVQYSVYARICNGLDSVETHRVRVLQHVPSHGAVRMMVITERQFNAIEILIGEEKTCDLPQNSKQLMEF